MSKKLIIAIIAIVLAVAIPVTLLVVLGGDKDSNKGNNQNQTPGVNLDNMTVTEQYAYFEGNALHTVADVLLADGTGSDTDDALKSHSSVTMDIIPSQYLLSMMGAQDLDWVEKLSMNMDVKLDGSTMEFMMGLGLNGKDIANLAMISDPLSGISYISIPTVSKYYLKSPTAVSPNMGADMEELKELLSALPAMRESVNKYIDLALAEMTNVEKGTETVKIGNKSEKVTVLSNYITEAVAVEIVKSVLTEAKNDSALKSLLPDDVDMEAEIDTLLADLPANPSNDKNEAIVLKIYLNNNNEVIGRSLDAMGKTQIFCLSIADGDAMKLGFVTESQGSTQGITLEITDGSIVLSATEDGETNELASLTYSGDDKNGNAVLKITALNTGAEMALNLNWTTSGDKTVVTIALQAGGSSVEVATITCTGNEDKGSVELKLSDAIERLLFNTTEMDPSMLISWDGEASSQVELFMMGEKLVTLAITATEKTPGNIQLPSNVLDMSDPNAMQTFANSINLNTLRQNMLNAGIPAQLVNQLINNLQSSLG